MGTGTGWQSIEPMLANALGLYVARRWPDAQAACRQLLTQLPDQPGARLLLETLLHADSAEAHANLGIQLWRSRRFQDALSACQAGIEAGPDHANAHHNYAVALRNLNRLDEAARHFRRAPELAPDRADSHQGWYPTMSLFRQPALGDWQPAIRRVARELAELVQRQAPANRGGGKDFELVKKWGQAPAKFRFFQCFVGIGRSQSPFFHKDFVDHGNRMLRKGRLDQAIAAYRMAVRLSPEHPAAHNNLGTALKEAGHMDEAIVCYRQALTLKPESHVYHYNLGNALEQQGRLEEAAAAYRRAIELQPDFVLAHCSLGTTLKDLQRLDEAIACYQHALALQPDFQPAHYNLGNAMKDAGNVAEAVKCFRRALQLNPADCRCHSNLAYTMHFDSAYDAPAILAENRRWDEAHGQKVARFSGPWPNSPDPERRLARRLRRLRFPRSLPVAVHDSSPDPSRSSQL